MTKKIKRLTVWITVNAFMGWCMWQGVFNHVEWAQNVLKFAVWLNFCMTILLFVGSVINSDVRESAQKSGLPVPATVSLAYDLGMAGELASAGWFGYAGLMIVQGLMYVAVHSKEKDTPKNG